MNTSKTVDQTSANESSQQAVMSRLAGEDSVAVHLVTESSLAATRAELSATARRHKRTVDVAVFSMVALTLVYTCAVQTLIRLNDGNIDFWTKVFPILTVLNLVLVGASAGVVAVMLRNRTRTARRFASAMSADSSVESVGALVDLFTYDTLDAHETAKRGLTRLLPRLRADQSPLLTPEHRAVLNRKLASPPEQVGDKDIRELFRNTTDRELAFRLAILKAYEQVGDASAIPIVRRLAETGGPAALGLTEAQRQVKTAAEECLLYLKVRVEKQTAHNSLLRGASLERASAKSLLRAASGVRTADAAELVRADAAPE